MSKLYAEPMQYVNDNIKELRKLVWLLKVARYILFGLILLFTAAIPIITAMVLSKIVFQAFPQWFFFVITGLSAMIALCSGLLNAFSIKTKLKTKNKHILLLEAEKLKYKNGLTEKYSNEGKEYRLYLRVSAILGNTSSKKEVRNA